MGKIVVGGNVALDGVVEDPAGDEGGGREERHSGGSTRSSTTGAEEVLRND